MIEKMRLYYVAYRWPGGAMEMIDGPYGTRSEAYSEKDSLDKGGDPHLIVVCQNMDVKEVGAPENE